MSAEDFPTQDAYRRGYLSGRAADNPFAEDTPASDAFIIGVADRANGEPARAAELRLVRDRRRPWVRWWSLFQQPETVIFIRGGRVHVQGRAGGLLDHGEAQPPPDNRHKGTLL